MTESTIDIEIDPGRQGFTQSGAKCILVFTPSRERGCGRPRITTWANVGPGTPESVWNRRALTLGDVQGRDGESIVEILREHEADLLALDALYQGSEWDGHNHVGRWDRDAEDPFPDAVSEITIDLEHELEQAATYWDASDWLDGAELDVLEAARKFSDIDSYAEHIMSEARIEGALVEQSSVADWLRERLVVVETMPEQYRESHRAADNWGKWPHNGATHSLVTSEEADEIVESDEYGYATSLRSSGQ